MSDRNKTNAEDIKSKEIAPDELEKVTGGVAPSPAKTQKVGAQKTNAKTGNDDGTLLPEI